MDMIYASLMPSNFITVNRKKNPTETLFNTLTNTIFNLNKSVWFNIRTYMHHNPIRHAIKWPKNVSYDKTLRGEM